MTPKWRRTDGKGTRSDEVINTYYTNIAASRLTHIDVTYWVTHRKV